MRNEWEQAAQWMDALLQVLKQLNARYLLTCGAHEIEPCGAGSTFDPRHGHM